jgi:ankyrin repeat protein
VTIHGDGNVHFSGQREVLIPGEHDAHIAPAAVKELIRQFEKTKFFAADDKYIATITDDPTYELTLTVAGKKKIVTDYVGKQVGMPLFITDLENAVDDVAGTHRWIKGNEQTLASLEEERWSFTSTSAQNLNLYSAVIREKNQQLIEQFLTKRAPIYSADDSAPSPVCTASEMGDLSLVRRMMNWYSAPNEGTARSGGRLPKPVSNRCLADAAGSGQVELVQFWLSRGADPKATPKRRVSWASGESVLASAIRSENPEVVREILKYKVDLHRLIDDTEPILSYALENGQFGKGEGERTEIVKMLIKAGADVNARGRIGQTPIFCAIKTPGAVKLLVAAGADINARDVFGNTALIRNAYYEPFIEEMLRYGANPAAVNNNGDTPLKRTDFCRPCAALIEAALKSRTGAGDSTQ